MPEGTYRLLTKFQYVNERCGIKSEDFFAMIFQVRIL
jgi:hypothetical protein